MVLPPLFLHKQQISPGFLHRIVCRFIVKHTALVHNKFVGSDSVVLRGLPIHSQLRPANALIMRPACSPPPLPPPPPFQKRQVQITRRRAGKQTHAKQKHTAPCGTIRNEIKNSPSPSATAHSVATLGCAHPCRAACSQ